MPKGEFIKGCNRLLKIVGDKEMEGKLVVDQVYAKFQHESLDLQHPTGGAKFLTKALLTEYRSVFRGLARDAYRPLGLASAMAAGMERVNKTMSKNAPRMHRDLRNSGAPSVKDRGRFVYKRAPVVPRLSKSQLKARDRARGKS
jgi:hypothetical protein